MQEERTWTSLTAITVLCVSAGTISATGCGDDEQSEGNQSPTVRCHTEPDSQDLDSDPPSGIHDTYCICEPDSSESNTKTRCTSEELYGETTGACCRFDAQTCACYGYGCIEFTGGCRCQYGFEHSPGTVCDSPHCCAYEESRTCICNDDPTCGEGGVQVPSCSADTTPFRCPGEGVQVSICEGS